MTGSVKSILVAGATGLVGGHCVRQLLAHPAAPRVIALARDPATAGFARQARLILQKADYERLADAGVGRAADSRLAADAVICALGTTISKAGSQDAFRRVDLDYVVAAARLGLAAGASHFLLVSSLGADPRSRVFYSRVKGEAEQAVQALRYHAVTILRPSLLLGERPEFRFGEEAAKRLGWLVPGKYRPVQAADVACVLVAAALAPARGSRILESGEIRRLARQTTAGSSAND